MNSPDHSRGKGQVIAHVNYFPALGTSIPTSAWKKRYLGIGDEHTRPMVIRDVRESQRVFDLSTNGFSFVKLPSRHRVDSCSTEETIRQEYYPELEALAKSL